MANDIPKNTPEKSIRPNFLGGTGGGDTPAGLNMANPGIGREDASNRAADSLASAEKSATGGGIPE